MLVAVIFGFGLMATLTVAFGKIERRVASAHARSLLHGLTFGVGAVLAMLEPVHLTDGVIFDVRATIVGLAAAFGGWPAAVLSAAIAVGVRASIGGIGMASGVSGIVMAAGFGLLWALRFKPAGRASVRQLAGLGALIALYTASVVLLPPPMIWPVATTAVPIFALASVVGAIVMGHLLDRERANVDAEADWRRDAHTDPLTGLANRRALDRSLAKALAASSGRRPCSLLLLDVDLFKAVNDRHGHPCGDAALASLGETLRRVAPRAAAVCRFGGEEFAVVLDDASPDIARAVAESLREAVQATPFVHGGSEIALTVSVGVATGHGATGADALMRSADLALYAAKTGGRNRVVFNGSLPGADGGTTSVLLGRGDGPQAV